MEIHGIGFLLVDLATLILFALTIDVDKEDLQKEDVADKDYYAHYIIGVIFFALIMLHHIIGIYFKFSIENKNKINNRIPLMKLGH